MDKFDEKARELVDSALKYRGTLALEMVLAGALREAAETSAREEMERLSADVELAKAVLDVGQWVYADIDRLVLVSRFNAGIDVTVRDEDGASECAWGRDLKAAIIASARSLKEQG